MTEKDLQIQELKAENTRIRHSNALLEEELKEYRELEERGLLLKLPCKVGDTVYEIAHDAVNRLRVTGFRLGKMMCEDDEEFEEEHIKDEWYFEAEGPWYDCSRMLSDFGKAVFLTKQEAKQALEKMKE